MSFTCVPEQGYFLEIASKQGRYEHILGGQHEIPGAYCLTCKRLLLLMLALDTRDPRVRIKFTLGRTHTSYLPKFKKQPLYHLPLFYCWCCGARLDYRLNPEGGVDVLNHTDSDMAGSCFPYEPYPRSFPGRWIRLEPVPPEVQELIRRDNQGKLKDKYGLPEELRCNLRPRHQVGGQAHFQQRMCVKGGWKCTLCGKDSPFLASIADETAGKKTFHGGAYVQVIFHYCAPCQVVSAYHECD